jgi:hypothetical protein
MCELAYEHAITSDDKVSRSPGFETTLVLFKAEPAAITITTTTTTTTTITITITTTTTTTTITITTTTMSTTTITTMSTTMSTTYWHHPGGWRSGRRM